MRPLPPVPIWSERRPVYDGVANARRILPVKLVVPVVRKRRPSLWQTRCRCCSIGCITTFFHWQVPTTLLVANCMTLSLPNCRLVNHSAHTGSVPSSVPCVTNATNCWPSPATGSGFGGFGQPLPTLRAALREAFNIETLAQDSSVRWLREAALRERLGDRFFAVSVAVAELVSGTPPSSVIENLNSRLRNYFFLRRHLGPDYLALLQFFLNRRRFLRSERPERVGKSPVELLTGEAHPHWLELLGYTPVLPQLTHFRQPLPSTPFTGNARGP